MKIADVLPQLTIMPLRRFGDAWGVTPITTGQRNVVEQAIVGEVHRIDNEEAVKARWQSVTQKVDYARRTTAELVLRMIVDQPGYVLPDAFAFVNHIVPVGFELSRIRALFHGLAPPRSTDSRCCAGCSRSCVG
ncbi:MAG TPA: hypothetical protein VIP09_14790 [Dehalococcoidia bacterium]